jgi:hypothetical protein
VLRPGGACAPWTFEKFRVDPAVDACVDAFYRDAIGPYWPPERRHVEQAYRTLPLPYDEIPTPPFELVTEWRLPQVLDHLGTWSAVQRARAATGTDPLPVLAARLAEIVAPDAALRLRWPIHLRIGRT